MAHLEDWLWGGVGDEETHSEGSSSSPSSSSSLHYLDTSSSSREESSSSLPPLGRPTTTTTPPPDGTTTSMSLDDLARSYPYQEDDELNYESSSYYPQRWEDPIMFPPDELEDQDEEQDHHNDSNIPQDLELEEYYYDIHPHHRNSTPSSLGVDRSSSNLDSMLLMEEEEDNDDEIMAATTRTTLRKNASYDYPHGPAAAGEKHPRGESSFSFLEGPIQVEEFQLPLASSAFPTLQAAQSPLPRPYTKTIRFASTIAVDISMKEDNQDDKKELSSQLLQQTQPNHVVSASSSSSSLPRLFSWETDDQEEMLEGGRPWSRNSNLSSSQPSTTTTTNRSTRSSVMDESLDIFGMGESSMGALSMTSHSETESQGIGIILEDSYYDEDASMKSEDEDDEDGHIKRQLLYSLAGAGTFAMLGWISKRVLRMFDTTVRDVTNTMAADEDDVVVAVGFGGGGETTTTTTKAAVVATHADGGASTLSASLSSSQGAASSSAGGGMYVGGGAGAEQAANPAIQRYVLGLYYTQPKDHADTKKETLSDPYTFFPSIHTVWRSMLLEMREPGLLLPVSTTLVALFWCISWQSFSHLSFPTTHTHTPI